jgi:hypothetical protein
VDVGSWCAVEWREDNNRNHNSDDHGTCSSCANRRQSLSNLLFLRRHKVSTLDFEQLARRKSRQCTAAEFAHAYVPAGQRVGSVLAVVLVWLPGGVFVQTDALLLR